VTEQQVAERVDQARHERQAEQQRRERTVPAGATRHDYLSHVVYKLACGPHRRQWPWHTCAKHSAVDG
jgi:hypothetical protein